MECRVIRGEHLKKFAFRVWRLIYWERKRPKPTTVWAWKVKLSCVATRRQKRIGKIHWRKRRAAFYEHRREKLKERQELQERLRYLPFDCGDGVRSAIDCDIMWCESAGSYTAENPSGAYGKYQLMPEHWDHLGRQPTPAEQDRIASELWDGGAGRSNWVC